MTFRKLLATCHRWGGLMAMPVLVCVALTGAILAAAPWLDRLAAPRCPTGRALPESELLAHAAAAAPPGDPVASVEWLSPGQVQRLTLRSGERWYVDPTSGAVIERTNGETTLDRFIGNAHQLHVRLLAGNAGEWLVDLATVVACFSTLSGVVLWWKRRRIRVGPGSSGRRWWRELHDVIGVWASLVVFLLTLSGIFLAWEDSFDALLGLPVEREPALPHSTPPAGGVAAAIGADEWLAAARRALPNAPVSKLSLPASERSPVLVTFERAGRPGRSAVWLDRYDARVLRVDDFRSAPRAFRAHVFVRALHTGGLAGTGTQVVVLLGCVSLAALALTGLVTWRLKPAAARPRSSQVDQRAQ